VIPALLEKIIIKNQYPVELLGNPQATRPFTFVDDAISATVEIIERAYSRDTSVQQNDFNIGNDTYYTIEELAKVIWQLYGDGREFAFTAVQTNAITADRREVDIKKIRDVVGWEPKVTLEQGLPIVAEWLRNR
jgi:UDP-glucuronate decarboxylase